MVLLLSISSEGKDRIETSAFDPRGRRHAWRVAKTCSLLTLIINRTDIKRRVSLPEEWLYKHPTNDFVCSLGKKKLDRLGSQYATSIQLWMPCYNPRFPLEEDYTDLGSTVLPHHFPHCFWLYKRPSGIIHQHNFVPLVIPMLIKLAVIQKSHVFTF